MTTDDMISQVLSNTVQRLTTQVTYAIYTDSEANQELDRFAKTSEPFLLFVPPATTTTAKYQGSTILAEYDIRLIFAKFIPNSSMDGKTETEVYPIVEAMKYVAIEFFNALQQNEFYRRAQNTRIDYELADLLDYNDQYLAGCTATAKIRLLVPWDYCARAIKEFVLLEDGSAVLTD